MKSKFGREADKTKGELMGTAEKVKNAFRK
jgi:hypothetical protein